MERLSRVFHADRVLKHAMENLLGRNSLPAATQAGLPTAIGAQNLYLGQLVSLCAGTRRLRGPSSTAWVGQAKPSGTERNQPRWQR